MINRVLWNQLIMNKKKQEIRQVIWKKLKDSNAASFPFPVEGRIPNYKGSPEAAALLTKTEFWNKAKIIKANPDSPQKYIRELALRYGKKIFMAVPKLAAAKPFLELDPCEIGNHREAASIKGAVKFGKAVSLGELPLIDLIITGSVAINRDGRRLGKGGGYSDMEYALAKTYGKITDATLIVTTVHPLQITDMDIPKEEHDITVEYIVTPGEVIKATGSYSSPEGIIREILSQQQINEIPALAEIIGSS